MCIRDSGYSTLVLIATTLGNDQFGTHVYYETAAAIITLIAVSYTHLTLPTSDLV